VAWWVVPSLVFVIGLVMVLAVLAGLHMTAG